MVHTQKIFLSWICVLTWIGKATVSNVRLIKVIHFVHNETSKQTKNRKIYIYIIYTHKITHKSKGIETTKEAISVKSLNLLHMQEIFY